MEIGALAAARRGDVASKPILASRVVRKHALVRKHGALTHLKHSRFKMKRLEFVMSHGFVRMGHHDVLITQVGRPSCRSPPAGAPGRD